MQDIEPFYSWRSLYKAEKDPKSPYHQKEYSQFEYSESIYDHFIHPQWDEFGSSSLFLKILYCHYQQGFVVIELMGEWNDCLHNDIMLLKRNIIDQLLEDGIQHFILIGENVLNFHYSDQDYYQEWFEELEYGWIVLLGFRDHNLQEMKNAQIEQYLLCGDYFNNLNWRSYKPEDLFFMINQRINSKLLP